MSALKPDVDGTHDLGTTALRWRALHVDTITTATAAQGGSDCTVGTNLVVTGNLTVNGDTTTLSTSTLNVEDKLITIANGAADSAAADGAGITVDGASASLLYDHTGTQWEFNKPLEVTGHVLPNATATYDLGSTSLGWNDLHLDSGGVINFDDGDVTATHSANLLSIAGGNTRVIRLEIDGANDHIDVNTDLTLTSSADIALVPGGGDVKVTGNLLPNADNGGALGASGTEWSDLFLHTGGVINFEAGDVTLTHSSNLLSIAGGTTRVAKLEIDGANDHIDVSTDLTLTANADIALVPGGGDVAVTGNVVPNADDGGTLGSANLNWSDLYIADAGVLNLGDDQDIKITHVADTGLLLTTTAGDGDVELQIRDSGLKIHSSANGQLDIDSDGEVEISAVTNVDIDAADVQIDASATFSIQGADDSDVTVAAEAKDLSLTVSGGGAQVLSLNSAGTGTDAIDINATAGGIDIDANGALSLDGGTINIGTASDVAVDVDSSTFDLDASGAITIDGTSTIGIGTAAAAGNISIGTNATARIITVGNTTGATSLKLDAGAGGILIGDAADALINIDATTFDLDASSTMSLDSADTTNLTMTANAGGNKTLTVAAANSGGGEGHLSLTSDSQVTATDGTATLLLDGGAVTIDTSGVVELNSSGAAIGIGNDNVNQNINIGTSGSRTLTVGSDNATKVDVNAATIEADATTKILLDSAGTGSDSIDINSAGGLDVDVADAISLTTTSADGHIEIVSAHTSGTAFHLDANADAGSAVLIDAGHLDMNVTGTADIEAGAAISLQAVTASDFTTSSGAITIDGAGGVNIAGNAAEVDITTSGALDINSGAATIDVSTLSIDSTDTSNLTMTANNDNERVLTIDAVNSGAGAAKIALGATSGTAISIGHGTSETTVNDNLTVTGNLTVNGDTVTVDTTNLTVEDPLIKLNKGDTGNPSRDQGLVFSRGNGTTADKANRVFIWDETEDEFAFGVAAEEAGTTSGNVSISAYSDVTLGKLVFDSAAGDNIEIDSSNLTVSSTADIALVPGGSDVLVTGNILPVGDDTFDLGSSSAAWKDLNLEGDVKMTDAGQVVTAAGALTLSGAGGVTVTSTGGTLSLNGTGQTVDLNAAVLDLDMTDASTITLTSAEDQDDLTIEQSGGTDSSVIIQSSGTGIDAIKLDAYGGSIKVDSADNISIDAADLISLTTADSGADGKISLVSSTQGSNVAIHLDGNANAASIVDIDAGVLDIDADGTVNIDGAGGINIGTASDVAFDIDSAAVDWDASGAFELDVSGAGISLQGGAASDFTTGAGALTLSGAGGVTVTSTGGTLSLNGTGQTVDLNAAVLDLDMTDASNISLASAADADDLTIELTGATNSSIDIKSTGTGADAVKISTSAGSIDIDSADNLTIDAADDISLTSTSADGLITLHSAHTAGQAILIDANAAAGSILDVDAGILTVDTQGAQTLTSGGTFGIDSTGAVTIDSDAGLTLGGSAVDVDADGGTLSLDGSGGINIGTAANVAVDLNASTLDVDGTGLLSLDTTDTSNGVTIATATSGVPVSIGHSTSETTVNDNLTVAGTSDLNGLTTLGGANLFIKDSVGGTTKFKVLSSTGNTTIDGTLTVKSSITGSAGELEINDTLVSIGKDGNANADEIDIGIYAPLTAGENLGLIWDQSDAYFKLNHGLNNPTDNVFDFATGSPSTLELGRVFLNDHELLAVNQSSGTVSTSKHATLVSTGSDGIDHVDLAAGSEGQVKVIGLKADGGDNLRVDVTNAAWGGSGTITLDTVGQACTLQYIDSKWYCIGNNGCTFA